MKSPPSGEPSRLHPTALTEQTGSESAQFRGHCDNPGKRREGNLGGTSLPVIEEIISKETDGLAGGGGQSSPTFLTGANDGRTGCAVPTLAQEGKQL